MEDQGFDPGALRHRRALDMRYHGQEHTVRLAVGETDDRTTLERAFHDAHRQQYTFALEGTPVEVVNFRLTTTVELRRPTIAQVPKAASAIETIAGSVRERIVDVEGTNQTARVFMRSELPLGFRGDGPAIVEEASATTVVLGGQSFEVDGFGNLLITPG
jgi:N-methylhydantoinase A